MVIKEIPCRFFSEYRFNMYFTLFCYDLLSFHTEPDMFHYVTSVGNS